MGTTPHTASSSYLPRPGSVTCSGLQVREPTPEWPKKPRLLDQVRQAIRARHYSPRTERAYVGWVRRFILFHGKRHPSEMGEIEVTQFLSFLATSEKVSASTQNQALNALLFLYREVLRKDLDWLKGIVRAKRPVRLPVVLSREEVRSVIDQLCGVERLMASIIYGAGLRITECLQLRIKDVDFATNEITVRGGKGRKDRVTILPRKVRGPLELHIETVHRQHDADLRRGAGSVQVPNAIERKYPRAAIR